MSRKRNRSKKHDRPSNISFCGFENVDHPLFLDEDIEDMILKSAFNKLVVPKKYDVNFTYSMKELSNNESDKFNKVSDYFETAIMNLLSDMMDYCTEIQMEVIKK